MLKSTRQYALNCKNGDVDQIGGDVDLEFTGSERACRAHRSGVGTTVLQSRDEYLVDYTLHIRAV
jgi:hypothetical protein